MYATTDDAFLAAVNNCKALFLRKAADYGGSWRLFRLPSLTDQIFIKARRIRQLEELEDGPAVPEGAAEEYMGIFNYAVMALMRLWYPGDLPEIDLGAEQGRDPISLTDLAAIYQRVADRLRELMRRKNHDYGEAWRAMRLSSITDQVLVRVWRLKKMEDNAGRTLASEGADANYADIANYCVFALIRLSDDNDHGGDCSATHAR